MAVSIFRLVDPTMLSRDELVDRIVGYASQMTLVAAIREQGGLTDDGTGDAEVPPRLRRDLLIHEVDGVGLDVGA